MRRVPLHPSATFYRFRPEAGDIIRIRSLATGEARARDPSHVRSALLTRPGYDFTCGLTREGEVYCWGRNFYGLGRDGHAEHLPMPIREPAPLPAG